MNSSKVYFFSPVIFPFLGSFYLFLLLSPCLSLSRSSFLSLFFPIAPVKCNFPVKLLSHRTAGLCAVRSCRRSCARSPYTPRETAAWRRATGAKKRGRQPTNVVRRRCHRGWDGGLGGERPLRGCVRRQLQDGQNLLRRLPHPRLHGEALLARILRQLPQHHRSLLQPRRRRRWASICIGVVFFLEHKLYSTCKSISAIYKLCF
ncbi:hypothetical protein KSP39_PZI018388 [Platanthera zijinensis]|uniref:Uncharacterized protein n=1 Tax=Platanthera zijinensis TaxID=2320716 RepID=A0AAP0FZ91_9ASPA